MTTPIIAVDFDGTIVATSKDYPQMGAPLPGAIETLKWLQERGARLILWTMRSGIHLQEAVVYLAQEGITFWNVNLNPEQIKWTNSPKVYAHLYIDDAALGCPLNKEGNVDWRNLRPMLARWLEMDLPQLTLDQATVSDAKQERIPSENQN